MSYKRGKRSEMTRAERRLARVYDRLRKRAQRTMSPTAQAIYLQGVTDALDKMH